jgi:hypothetical protein
LNVDKGLVREKFESKSGWKITDQGRKKMKTAQNAPRRFYLTLDELKIGTSSHGDIQPSSFQAERTSYLWVIYPNESARRKITSHAPYDLFIEFLQRNMKQRRWENLSENSRRKQAANDKLDEQKEFEALIGIMKLTETESSKVLNVLKSAAKRLHDFGKNAEKDREIEEKSNLYGRTENL